MAVAQHRYYREIAGTMTLFYYGFSLALSLALGIAIGGAWVRDNQFGVWTRRVIAILAVTIVGFGLILGWAVATWMTFVLNSASGRVP